MGTHAIPHRGYLWQVNGQTGPRGPSRSKVSPSSPYGPCDDRVRSEAVVQEAIGVLMHRLDLCSEDACALLGSSARASNRDAAHVARTILSELEDSVFDVPG